MQQWVRLPELAWGFRLTLVRSQFLLSDDERLITLLNTTVFLHSESVRFAKLE
ncbi:hypothetical protein [Acaryochloris sp. CCMEE 5410]|uniref:hypothetical protein n=1 Tax=Acaryochloris sp. CCMEE 5410 TaxID=310037 RepID=UPI0002D3DFC7|nr:hypothetical protein [Acaryochloris sp. CCMEE 5410]KAI9131391.1 hypothetical protein ON05_027600 [Acaryochloris sp. CCMEE 5410]